MIRRPSSRVLSSLSRAFFATMSTSGRGMRTTHTPSFATIAAPALCPPPPALFSPRRLVLLFLPLFCFQNRQKWKFPRPLRACFRLPVT